MTFEVVWNAAIDRAWVLSQHRPPPPEDPSSRRRGVLDPTAARADNLSTRGCDRLVVHLFDNPQAEHTPQSVAAALGLPNNTVSVMLARLARRGVVAIVGQGQGRLARQRIYRVRPEARR